MGADDMPVTSELMAWLALRRVQQGGMAVLDGGYYHHGRPVPQYLNAPLAELVESGQLVLAKPDPEGTGMRRVMVTESGQQWYALLCGTRNTAPVPRVGPCPSGGCRL